MLWRNNHPLKPLRFPNLYIDTSAYVPSRYPPALVEYMRGRGAKRVMYGSNYPMLQHQAISKQLDMLKLEPETLELFLRVSGSGFCHVQFWNQQLSST